MIYSSFMTHDPVMRVLTVLEILQAQDRVTGSELAERLEVDLRTVQRYIARLKDLDIPVASTPGVGGAYWLRPGFKVPPLLLTNEEAFALSLGLRSLLQIGLEAFAPATEGALSKLERVLPESLRESIRTAEDVVAVEPSRWSVSTPALGLMTAASAIRAERRVRFTYMSRDEVSSRREVEPYAVLRTDDRWYLIGRCLQRRAVRTFRLDRIDLLQTAKARFRRPHGFSAQRYLEERLPFLASDHHVDLWIDLPIEEAKRSFALWRVSMEAEGAGTRVRCNRENLDFFAAMLLSTRKKIVVHSPEKLKQTFHELAAYALQAAGGRTVSVKHTPR